MLGKTVSAASIHMNYTTCQGALLMAFIMSLQETIWRSVIMPEMILF
jgi:hypothetical protein